MALPMTSQLTRQLTGFGDALGDRGQSISSPNWTKGVQACVRPTIPSSFEIDDGINRLFEVRCAGVTDPGVAGKQNQDDFFLWESEDQRCLM